MNMCLEICKGVSFDPIGVGGAWQAMIRFVYARQRLLLDLAYALPCDLVNKVRGFDGSVELEELL